MDRRRLVTVSKFLSRVLRHRPEMIGITLDPAGWATASQLLEGCRRHGCLITLEELQWTVENNDKQRFAFSEDGQRIRADQGHSVPVALGYDPVKPPEMLYHGTAKRHVPSIREQGLLRRQRHHVHLSGDPATAFQVGSRHGEAIVLKVQAGRMNRAGFRFYLSANGVWLTEAVPPTYLLFPD